MQPESDDTVSFGANMPMLEKVCKWLIPVVIALPLLLRFRQTSFSWGEILINYAVMFTLLGGMWWYLRYAVVCALNKDGLYGQGGAKRKPNFGWADEIKIEYTVVQGVEYLKITPANSSPFKFLSLSKELFISEYVYSSEKFRAAVKQFAPVSHPLRSWVSNQTTPTA
jgi:hypothetical protein